VPLQVLWTTELRASQTTDEAFSKKPTEYEFA